MRTRRSPTAAGCCCTPPRRARTAWMTGGWWRRGNAAITAHHHQQFRPLRQEPDSGGGGVSSSSRERRQPQQGETEWIRRGGKARSSPGGPGSGRPGRPARRRSPMEVGVMEERGFGGGAGEELQQVPFFRACRGPPPQHAGERRRRPERWRGLAAGAVPASRPESPVGALGTRELPWSQPIIRTLFSCWLIKP